MKTGLLPVHCSIQVPAERHLLPTLALVLLAVLALSPWRVAAQAFDDFESYATGSNLHGQGGWAGWLGDPSVGAVVSGTFSYSPTRSVNITGASDLVRTFSGATNGQWVFSVMQYVPSSSTGTNYLVLLNTYRPPYGANDLNWSVQLQNNLDTGQIISDLGSNGTLPLIKDQWVEVRCEINLALNLVAEYYNGQLLSTHAWQGAGLNEIQALDLYAGNSGPVYFDNVKLSEQVPIVVTQFPFGLGFEVAEGYLQGNLDGQLGWTVERGQAEVWTTTVFSGAQAARIAPAGEISHGFTTASPIVTFNAYMQAAPSGPPEIPVLAQAAVLYLDSSYGVTGLDGDGNGGGNWVGSGVTVQPGTWFQVTLRLNFVSKTWSCAVNGTTVLTGLHFHSDSLAAFASLSAAAESQQTLLDDARITAENAPAPTGVSLLPFGSGFEPQEGYVPGDLNHQLGWLVDSGSAQVWSNTVYSGVQAARVGPGGQISHGFATAGQVVTFDTYLQATPSAPPEIPDTAQITVLYLDPTRGITGWDGDGNGWGNWVGSGVTVPSNTWFQATIRMNFASKTWSCAVNGTQVLSNMHFHANNISTFASFTAGAPPAGVTLMDQINLQAEQGPPALPTLTIALSGTSVDISWPAQFGGFRLQATTSLAAPDWTNVVTSGNHLSEPIAPGSKFYRLMAP